MKSEDIKDVVFLILVVGRKQKESILSAVTEAGGKLINTVYGRGTVKISYIKSMFGFVPEENKVLITCLMKREHTDTVFNMLNEKFQFDKPNTGIAFTIPVQKLSF